MRNKVATARQRSRARGRGQARVEREREARLAEARALSEQHWQRIERASQAAEGVRQFLYGLLRPGQVECRGSRGIRFEVSEEVLHRMEFQP